MQLDRCFAKHGATRPKHRKHGATRPKHGATRPKHRKHGATRPKHWKASKRTLRVGWESPSILALRALWGSSGQNRVTRYRSTCYSNTLHRRINDFVPDTTLMRWGHVQYTVWGCGTMQDANNWCDNTDDPCVFVRVRKWGNVRVCVRASEVMQTTVTDNTILGARACGVVWWWTHTVEEPCGQLPGALLKIAPVSCWDNRAMIFIHQK